MIGATTTKNAPAERQLGEGKTIHATTKEHEMTNPIVPPTADNAQDPEQGTGVYFELITFRDEVDRNKIIGFEFRHHEIHSDISVGVYGFPGIRTWSNAIDIADVELNHVTAGELIDAIKRARKLCRVLNADPDFAGTMVFDAVQRDAVRRASITEDATA